MGEESIFDDLDQVGPPRLVDMDGDGRPEILTIKTLTGGSGRFSVTYLDL